MREDVRIDTEAEEYAMRLRYFEAMNEMVPWGLPRPQVEELARTCGKHRAHGRLRGRARLSACFSAWLGAFERYIALLKRVFRKRRHLAVLRSQWSFTGTWRQT